MKEKRITRLLSRLIPNRWIKAIRASRQKRTFRLVPLKEYANQRDWIIHRTPDPSARVFHLSGLSDNPCLAVKGVKIKSKGHRTWTDDEIAAFEAFYPIGTEARLAFALLLYTGQRRSDVVRMGRQHVKDGVLTIAEEGRLMVEVSIPILPQLQAVLDDVQRKRMARPS